MAGHSKWSKVKHIKGPLDVKRGAMFSRQIKEITLAARLGGGDAAGNLRLRVGNVPEDNIERAAANRSIGELEATHPEEITCERYAPGSIAATVAPLIDDKNRTAADICGLFTKHHGSPATAAGRISCMFSRRAGLRRRTRPMSPERGGWNSRRPQAAKTPPTKTKNHFILTPPPDRFYAVDEALRAGGTTPGTQRLTFAPDFTVPITDGRPRGRSSASPGR